MAAILSTNMASLYAQKNLSTAQASLSESVQRLSSGTRINSAKDDAAGYGIAESVRGTKNIVDQNIRNAKDGISWAQTAEGALDVVGKMLQRALTLVTQRQDATLNSDQRNSIDAELDALRAEVNNITLRTKFQGGGNEVSVFGSNGLGDNGNTILRTDSSGNPLVGGDYYLIDNDLRPNVDFYFGQLAEDITSANIDLSGNMVQLSLANFSNFEFNDGGLVEDFLLNTINTMGREFLIGLDVTEADLVSEASSIRSSYISVQTGSSEATQVVATMIDPSDINGESSVDDIAALIAENASNRGTLGAAINSLEYAVDNMQTLSTNLADGISRIVDTDYAAETSNLTRTQIMQQAATSMLAQANQMPNVILTLLK
jgi:flagellin